jgi:sec-independent protein translocase protein TatA
MNNAFAMLGVNGGHESFAAILGGTELIVVFGAILVLFGAKKIPEFAKGLGQGIKEFKKASRDVTDEFHSAVNQEYTPPPPPPPRQLPPSQPASAPAEHAAAPASTVPKA